MAGYILRRLAHMIPVLFLITLFTFFLVRLVPGDPVTAMLGPRGTPERRAALERALRLDRPIWERYIAFWVGGAEPTSLARPTGSRLHDPVARNAGVLDRTDAAADLRRQGEDLSSLRLGRGVRWASARALPASAGTDAGDCFDHDAQ